MIVFYVVMAALLFAIVGVWNKVSDFRSAYLQAVLFLEVMNWNDGFVIDEGWVRFSKFWDIPGLEDMGLCAIFGVDVQEKDLFNRGPAHRCGDCRRYYCGCSCAHNSCITPMPIGWNDFYRKEVDYGVCR